MADSSCCPDFLELIHDLQIEIEEFGEDFVFLGFWKKKIRQGSTNELHVSGRPQQGGSAGR